jgi:SAM-dependent methyltransferase
MSRFQESNESWARKLAASWLGGEKFRWELYSACLAEALNPQEAWLDLGCGHSDFIAEHSASPAVGVDADCANPAPGLFVNARLEALPFAAGAAGTLSLRFVLEHIENPERLWEECARVLLPGGRLVLITTNRISPLVALAGCVPHRLRERLISRVFKVRPGDIFPTWHRWNTPRTLANPPRGFSLERIEYVEALDWTRRFVFLALLLLAFVTRPRLLRPIRSNVVAVYCRCQQAEVQ